MPVKKFNAHRLHAAHAEPSASLPEAAVQLRHSHLGLWLGMALERYDARVFALMSANPALPLTLANYVRRGLVTAAQIHITRHLQPRGSRLTELATRAGMSKQAMNILVNQCEAMGLVEKADDPQDARAKQIRFTPAGLVWLQAFVDATAQAQNEFTEAVGAEVATVVRLGLEAYAQA